jgi:hypothetical protein
MSEYVQTQKRQEPFGKKLFNTREAADYLKQVGTPFTAGTLEVLRTEGRGPRYRKVTRKVFYHVKDLDKFSEGQVIETADSRPKDTV